MLGSENGLQLEEASSQRLNLTMTLRNLTKSEDITSVLKLKIAYQRYYFLYVYRDGFSKMARPYLVSDNL